VSLKGRLEEGPPKSDAGDRVVPLDPGTCAVMRAHRRTQRLERLRAGERWTDTRKVFTDELGAWLDPGVVSKTFRELVAEAGVAPTRLHDLRHCAASLILASDGTMKDAQSVLGHSSMMLTANTYSHLYADQQAESASRVAALVPRQAK
jgi:integrase